MYILGFSDEWKHGQRHAKYIASQLPAEPQKQIAEDYKEESCKICTRLKLCVVLVRRVSVFTAQCT